MKLGDKVKLIKGNPFGKVGRIILVSQMSKPANVKGRDIPPTEECFTCKAEDGTEFFGWEDDLELIE